MSSVAPVELLNALIFKSEYSTCLCTLTYIILNISVNCRYSNFITENCLRECNRYLTMNIISLSCEKRMRSYRNSYIEISCRASVYTAVTLTWKTNCLTVSNTCRNIKAYCFCDSRSSYATTFAAWIFYNFPFLSILALDYLDFLCISEKHSIFLFFFLIFQILLCKIYFFAYVDKILFYFAFL